MDTVFDRVWRLLAIAGYCDDQGSVQYLKVRNLWIKAGRFEDPEAIGNFIEQHARKRLDVGIPSRNPLG
jgi:hypothetical protein